MLIAILRLFTIAMNIRKKKRKIYNKVVAFKNLTINFENDRI